LTTRITGIRSSRWEGAPTKCKTTHETTLKELHTTIREKEHARYDCMLDDIREELFTRGFREAEHVIAKVATNVRAKFDKEGASSSSSSEVHSKVLSMPVLLNRLQHMWTTPDESQCHKYYDSNGMDGHSCQTWNVLASRYFGAVFDQYCT
jgi:hypothetical protein